jgi:hypothetical protein
MSQIYTYPKKKSHFFWVKHLTKFVQKKTLVLFSVGRLLERGTARQATAVIRAVLEIHNHDPQRNH